MATWRLKLLYDGQCPFCCREVRWLTRWDRAGRLASEDVTAEGFDPLRYGLTQAEVMSVLHGVKPDGTIVKRMEAVREAYGTVGLGWLIAPTRLPLLRGLCDALYGLFARNRVGLGQWLGRSCGEGGCDLQAGGDPRERD